MARMSFNEEKPMKKKKLEKDEVEKTENTEKKSQLIAKKHHIIFHPKDDGTYHRVIAPGDDLSDVPEMYHQNLKTEGVL
jgi:hypothetical protein